MHLSRNFRFFLVVFGGHLVIHVHMFCSLLAFKWFGINVPDVGKSSKTRLAHAIMKVYLRYFSRNVEETAKINYLK